MPGAPLSARARAYAPGGIGNLGPGVDVLGCAVTGAGDVVEAEWSERDGGARVIVVEPGHAELPVDPARHAAAIAATAVLRLAGLTPERAIALRITKGLPLAGGQERLERPDCS